MDPLLQYPKPLVGKRLPANTLAELVQSQDLIILQFLRHLGCIFCKNTVDGLYRIAGASSRFPPIVFVHQSPVEDAERFFEKHFPGAMHISDPRFELYEHFGVRRTSFLKVFSDPRVLWKALRLFVKGYGNERVVGDVRLLSATFLFKDGKLRWKHLANYPGDDPKWEKLA